MITDKVPCVSIVPRTDEEDYVEITGEPTGCFVPRIGNSGGRQILNLARNGCVVSNSLKVIWQLIIV